MPDKKVSKPVKHYVRPQAAWRINHISFLPHNSSISLSQIVLSSCVSNRYAHRQHGIMEILQRPARQFRIHTAHIGKERLQSRIVA